MSDNFANPIPSTPTSSTIPTPSLPSALTSSNNNNNNNPSSSLPASSQITETVFSAHLASALSTISDSQYFQDSISPNTVRSQLADATSRDNPSSASVTPVLLKSMKWLLASVSKGRDVSDFFCYVVKLVDVSSLEVRKMVYMFTVHYANHNETCRDLSLLSINSFQRALSDPEQLIRALSLRVLTSLHIPDVYQIQIIAMRTLAADTSPYVRKCAAVAIGKLYPRLAGGGGGEEGERGLEELLRGMLERESSTMVLSSVLCSFREVCPERLELLHGGFRKLCCLLVDMDEWGQIVGMDLLMRYCRVFFRRPGRGDVGSAEVIDNERRVVRRLMGDGGIVVGGGSGGGSGGRGGDFSTGNLLNAGETVVATPSRKKFVRKAFYSDEEDSSSSEDYTPRHTSPSLASTARQRNVLNPPTTTTQPQPNNNNTDPNNLPIRPTTTTTQNEDDDEIPLHPDHSLLLTSSLPLLKSRNSGVVTSVCALHYYCGRPTISIRSSLGRALVRIYRDRREIQYVVLCNIRGLVWECPSAFTPYLDDFLVKAHDPSFTRRIKLDILTALALEPRSIRVVLEELRGYVRHDDGGFVVKSVQAVGKLVELSRIVFDRRDAASGGGRGRGRGRAEANRIALDCLSGLLTLMESSERKEVVGECVAGIQRILTFLRGDEGRGGGEVEDGNGVRDAALRMLVLVLVRSLSCLERRGVEVEEEEDYDGEEEDYDGEGEEKKRDGEEELRRRIPLLPTAAVAPALWFLGEWLTNPTHPNAPSSTASVASSQRSKRSSKSSKKGGYSDRPPSAKPRNAAFATPAERQTLSLQLLRLLAATFSDIDPILRTHGVHFCSKLLLASRTDGTDNGGGGVAPLCEYVLSLGRVDTTPDVRDRARYESHLLHISIGLRFDTENLAPGSGDIKLNGSGGKLTPKKVAEMLCEFHKPSCSWLPIEKEDTSPAGAGEGGGMNAFRFGTLSSMVSHRVGGAEAGNGRSYLHLPPWADVDSPSKLRDPPEQQGQGGGGGGGSNFGGGGGKKKKDRNRGVGNGMSGFYDSDEDDSDETNSSESSSSGGEYTDGTTSSSEDDSSDDESSTSSEEEDSDDSDEDEDSSEEEEDTSSDDEEDTSSEEEQQQQRGGNMLLPMDVIPSVPQTADTLLPLMDSRQPSSSDDDLSASSSDDDDDDDDDDLSSSDDDGDQTKTLSLLDIPTSKPKTSSNTNSTNVTSLASGLEGLVMAPLPTSPSNPSPTTPSNEEVDIEKDSSGWKTLIRSDLSGGLAMEGRFLRGKAKEMEVMKAGVAGMGMGNGGNIVCVQVRFENRRTDQKPLRRIRIYQSTQPSSSTIPIQNTSLPPEIQLLPHAHTTHAILSIQFTTPSDKDGGLDARLDVRSDRGSTSVSIRPPLGEMLLGMMGGGMGEEEFDGGMGRLRGVHCRCVGGFGLRDGSGGGSVRDRMGDVLGKVHLVASLHPIGLKFTWNDQNQYKLVGRLPASGSPVFVLLECQPDQAKGVITVCCDDAMAVNTINQLIKNAVSVV